MNLVHGALGQAIIRDLIANDYRIICADLGVKSLEFARKSGTGQQLIPVTLDASDENAIHEFVLHNTEEYGIPDGLVVLTYGAAGKRFDEILADDFNRASHLGITSTFLLSRAVGEQMKINQKGSIVLFSSMCFIIPRSILAVNILKLDDKAKFGYVFGFISFIKWK